MKFARHKSITAFTLLEIMVALTLLSVIIIAIYSSWNSILKGSKVALDTAAATQRTRISMRTLQDSLLSACVFNANQRYYSFLADSEGDFASLSFVARLPKSFPRSGKFGDLDVRRLNFQVEEGTDGKKQLVLRQSPILMDPDEDEQKFPLILAKDVNKFILEFWDATNTDWSAEWTLTNRLPQMVKVTLALGRLDQFSTAPQEAVTGVVAMPAQPVRVEWQMPQLGAGGGGGVPPPPPPKLGGAQ